MRGQAALVLTMKETLMRNRKFQHMNNPAPRKNAWSPRTTKRSASWKIMALFICLALVVWIAMILNPNQAIRLLP